MSDNIATPQIIGIGSSAGGLKALQVLVSQLTSDFNFSYIIAQHLSPNHQSNMVKLLAKHSNLNVISAVDDIRIEKNRIYVCPENCNITVQDGRLKLSEPDENQSAIPNINKLLCSLATMSGAKSIGVIFSGVGSDGAIGMMAIKQAGGKTIIQSPEQAQYDGMPKAALAQVDIDYSVNTEELATTFKTILANDLITGENE